MEAIYRSKIQNMKHFFFHFNNQFLYMGQNGKNLYFWLFGVCVGGGGASMIRLGLFCFPVKLLSEGIKRHIGL